METQFLYSSSMRLYYKYFLINKKISLKLKAELAFSGQGRQQNEETAFLFEYGTLLHNSKSGSGIQINRYSRVIWKKS